MIVPQCSKTHFDPSCDLICKFRVSSNRNCWKCAKHTLQRTNAENSKLIFLEKEWRSHSPYFHIHESVPDLYISTIDLPILLQKNMRTDPGIYKLLIDTWVWKLELRGHAIPRKGIHKWDFVAVHVVFKHYYASSKKIKCLNDLENLVELCEGIGIRDWVWSGCNQGSSSQQLNNS